MNFAYNIFAITDIGNWKLEMLSLSLVVATQEGTQLLLLFQ